MRYINQIFTALPGKPITNEAMYTLYEPALDRLSFDSDARSDLKSIVRYYLFGNRSRQVVPDFLDSPSFAHRMQIIESTVDKTLDDLADQIRQSLNGHMLDAVFTTSSTCNLMPGISYRIAHRLGSMIRPEGLLMDLGNVGCTGSVQALKLADSMCETFDNMLVISIELTSTLVNLTSMDADVWQGNCTFGDGAAAVWLSSSPERGAMALRLDEIYSARQTDEMGQKLIHWTYDAFYTFRMAEDKTFNQHARRIVSEAMARAPSDWLTAPFWAVHPAGIALLMRIVKEQNLSPDILTPAIKHYGTCSIMSSASILFILKDIAETAPGDTPINLLTMGAGFNVMYGQVYKE